MKRFAYESIFHTMPCFCNKLINSVLGLSDFPGDFTIEILFSFIICEFKGQDIIGKRISSYNGFELYALLGY